MASIAFFFGTMRPQASFTASIAASTIGCIFSAGALKPLTGRFDFTPALPVLFG